MSKYETVIGLEIHAQLATESKMFCSCSTKFGAEPNTNVCEICTGQPGVLPKINKKAIELAIKTGLALNCKIEPMSVFARKNYFYPDLPKAYQISQYELPIITGGHLEIEIPNEGENSNSRLRKKINITRIHLEEDAGKLVHKGAERIMGSEESLVDYNRGGTPLMEIVTEPDIRSPLEAKIFMEDLAHLLQYIGVCDAKMEEGSLRCDANISIRPVGQKELGTKTELKNMNSFRFVQMGLEAEVARHTEMKASGEKIIQETRYFDTKTHDTKSMRSKEEAHDYRYFPEPDLVTIEPDHKWIEEIRATLTELPEKKRERYINEYGLPNPIAEVLIATKSISDYFEECLKIENKPKEIANWMLVNVMAYLKNKNLDIKDIVFSPRELIELIKLIEKGTISGTAAKEVLIKALETGKNIKDIVSESGATQISDEGALQQIVKEVIKNNPKQVLQFKSGKDPVIMYLVGQVMKESKGRAKPDLVQALLRKELS
ncbi:aspartyl/glutamyl-tRNA amidotransferase subunit B [candidate division WOR-1 bacterium RIFOXYA12_FULL_43_27]|uniref:Aspartyl/glutamyl-tRNA(Asn/Gln) amidotransferase subunit B n=1 Tax=candidate division WOR-1 bacterium RIFOXYC2_FULL_46_14 TaxID=1802587 RepID=A0A1F4U866_UNCSA|nr:MAG: aspartyl/glutamyl-tRNA amidotransferase subunit B [candidate division WOR-1 bacterium RIFOXYA12_FULL_43_27]OGC19451.1 MAG: aspartyl/glutamyl-tRNA amidotransferase subunit B [candidate division WOR-1 bacterium RIFOXYB2_FULL_46_45]OGC30440.1 MAG: aspartyl/glutamyl-tRNA amidotransferase subunit B [candidate division WOR-1 bacterium RIFOXYA2_FULL_46_56]OGC41040.1 MAG: aspartyl/glutamyl-tRNA amidotransferase subunit B [candidate division WOR-1 bacterium RIFOXYC2_FULL_46_14]